MNELKQLRANYGTSDWNFRAIAARPRLEAAAPDLLEACRCALVGFQEFERLFQSGRLKLDGQQMNPPQDGFTMSNKLRAAIAKAEGGA